MFCLQLTFLTEDGYRAVLLQDSFFFGKFRPGGGQNDGHQDAVRLMKL